MSQKISAIEPDHAQRINKAIVHSFEFKPDEKPRVIVKDLDSDTDDSHVVDMDNKSCTCKDYQMNLDDGEFCKHFWAALFKHNGLI